MQNGAKFSITKCSDVNDLSSWFKINADEIQKLKKMLKIY